MTLSMMRYSKEYSIRYSSIRRPRIFAALTMALLVTLHAMAAGAQSLSLGGVSGDQPIEVYAQDGIEWQQDKQIFVARGDARVHGARELRHPAEERGAVFSSSNSSTTPSWSPTSLPAVSSM